MSMMTDRSDRILLARVMEGDGEAFGDLLWEEGSMSPYPFTPRPAPSLVACVPPFDVVWVFPGEGEGFCESLGLSDLSPGYVEASRRFAAMRDDLERRLGYEEGRCTLESNAFQIAHEVLDVHGFGDWTVETGGGERGFGPERPCAEPSVDAGQKVIYLLPEPRLT